MVRAIRTLLIVIALVWPLGAHALTEAAPQPPPAGAFAGPVETARPVRPIVRERAVSTRFVLHRVACAGPQGGAATCFVTG